MFASSSSSFASLLTAAPATPTIPGASFSIDEDNSPDELECLLCEDESDEPSAPSTHLTPTLAAASLDAASEHTQLTPILATTSIDDTPMPLVTKKKKAFKAVMAGAVIGAGAATKRVVAPAVASRPPPKRVAADGDTEEAAAEADDAVQDSKRFRGYPATEHVFSGGASRERARGRIVPKFAAGSALAGQYGTSTYGNAPSSAGATAPQKKSSGHFNPAAADALVLHEPDPENEDDKVHVGVAPFLASKLRPHQVEGVQFLYNALLGRSTDLSTRELGGSILADDMGLGKTLQTIAVIYTLLYQGPSGKPHCRNAVVICPTTLCGNWKAECASRRAAHTCTRARALTHAGSLARAQGGQVARGAPRADGDHVRPQEGDHRAEDVRQRSPRALASSRPPHLPRCARTCRRLLNNRAPRAISHMPAARPLSSFARWPTRSVSC